VSNLYLASRSPRRRELLARLGQAFEQIEADIAEIPAHNEHALDYVCRIALEKALAVRNRTGDTIPILSADTEVVLDDRILGKPGNMEEAIRMLQSLSGREHLVHTAVVLLRDRPETLVSTSHVRFRPLSLEQCRRYCETNRPLDKAGAYGIQDEAAGFITRFDGSYTGVMGLPLAETARLLARLGQDQRSLT
jgi:septum formation protein